MSREERSLQRTLRREKPNDGAPLTEDQRALYILTERQLIGLLSERMALIDSTYDKTDRECLAVVIVGKAYDVWFHEQMDILNTQKFINLYNGTHGPMNLFQALFPGEEMNDFLARRLLEQQNEEIEERRQNMAIEEELKLSAAARSGIDQVIGNGLG